MFWNSIWNFLKNLWKNLTPTSKKPNTTLDTAKLNVFGMSLEVTREVAVDVPYELTVVVPRAEFRQTAAKSDLPAKNLNTEIILSSITIAHSPRLPNNRSLAQGVK